MLMQEFRFPEIPITTHNHLQSALTSTLKAPAAAMVPAAKRLPTITSYDVAPDAVPEIRFDEYRVVRLSLDKITFEAVQQALNELHRLYGANPEYMFISAVDREAIAIPEDHGIIRRLGHIFQVMNKTTGRLIYQVLLNNQEPNTVMFGFFPQR